MKVQMICILQAYRNLENRHHQHSQCFDYTLHSITSMSIYVNQIGIRTFLNSFATTGDNNRFLQTA